jgi:molecular chaperone DnaK
LSDEEVERMVKDAEAHAAEDKKFHELVSTRNTADGMIHATTKSMKELGDKLSEDEKAPIEAAIKELEEAMKGEDKDLIEAKTQALTEASGKMAEKLYAQNQEQGAADAAEGGTEQARPAGDDVVDAEFEEVDDNKK